MSLTLNKISDEIIAELTAAREQQTALAERIAQLQAAVDALAPLMGIAPNVSREPERQGELRADSNRNNLERAAVVRNQNTEERTAQRLAALAHLDTFTARQASEILGLTTHNAKNWLNRMVAIGKAQHIDTRPVPGRPQLKAKVYALTGSPQPTIQEVFEPGETIVELAPPRVICLSNTAKAALDYVAEHGPCAATQVADALAISQSGISTVVRRLIDKGLIDRGQRRMLTAMDPGYVVFVVGEAHRADTEEKLGLILMLAHEQGSVKNSDVCELFGIASSTASYPLKQLGEAGVLAKTGVRWVPAWAPQAIAAPQETPEATEGAQEAPEAVQEAPEVVQLPSEQIEAFPMSAEQLAEEAKRLGVTIGKPNTAAPRRPKAPAASGRVPIRGTSKEHKKLLLEAIEAGCSVQVAPNGHFKVTTPAGENLTMSVSPSDRNAHKQARRDLRRAGVAV